MLVSIIIPCYNLGLFVSQTIDSALAQTYPRVEVIVVNDGSTDDSLYRIRQYSSHVKIVNQANAGLGPARNAGIRESKGVYFLPLDADDCIEPSYLAETVPLMVNPRVGVVSTDMRYFGPVNDLLKTTGFSLEAEMHSNQIPSCSLIRRAAFDSTPGYARVACEDWNMWIDLLKRGWQVGYVPKPLFRYRIRRDSMSGLSEGREAQKLKEIMDLHPELNWKRR